MYKKIVLFLLLSATVCSVIKSQTKPEISSSGQRLYTYYLYIKGINSKEDVIKTEQKIRINKEVNFFLGVRYPVHYFTLKTNTPITKKQFISWLKNTPYSLFYFGEGEESLEDAIMTWKKLQSK